MRRPTHMVEKVVSRRTRIAKRLVLKLKLDCGHEQALITFPGATPPKRIRCLHCEADL